MKGAPGDALGSLEEGTCPCGQPAVVPSSEEGQGQPEDVRVVLKWEPGCRGAGRPPPRSPHTPHTHPLTTHTRSPHTHSPHTHTRAGIHTYLILLNEIQISSLCHVLL